VYTLKREICVQRRLLIVSLACTRLCPLRDTKKGDWFTATAPYAPKAIELFSVQNINEDTDTVGVSLPLVAGASTSLDAMLSKDLVPYEKLEKGDLLAALVPDPVSPKEKGVAPALLPLPALKPLSFAFPEPNMLVVVSEVLVENGY
jgi:hypothetical protein